MADRTLDGWLETHWRVRAARTFGLLAVLLLASCGSSGVQGPINQPPARAIDPEPGDGAGGVGLAPMLRWDGGADPDGDAVVFDIYLGVDEPLPLVATTTVESLALPERLIPELELHWRVVSRDVHGAATAGDTWSFRTAGSIAANHPPSSPANPDPADSSTSIPPEATLSWSGGVDSDLDVVSFDIHLGSVNPPPYVATQAGVGYDPPGDLAPETMYFWQVIARDDQGGVTPGPIWSFSTEPRPNQAPSSLENPQPPDGSTGVDQAAILQWSGGVDPDRDPVTFDVYFGTTNPPRLAATQTGTSYDPPGDLDYETTYFWQVVAADDRDGVTIGPIWSFSTESPPNQPPAVPENPAPANGAIAVAVDTILSWSGGSDPEGGPVDFHVYFGTDDPPPLAAIVSSPSYDPPGNLDPLTIYFWRIVAVDGAGEETSGGTWMFTTGNGARASLPTLAARSPIR